MYAGFSLGRRIRRQVVNHAVVPCNPVLMMFLTIPAASLANLAK